MRFSGKPRRGKRGVGSIIGATFIALILLSGFTFYTLVLSIIEHYNRTTDTMGELDWNRNREKLNIKDVKITGANKLNVTVENVGSVSSRLLWLGIFNKSMTPEAQGYYSLAEQVEPAETRSIISDFTVVKGNKYVVQLVTDLGNVFENKFYPASEVRCALTLVSVSPTAYQGNNITMFLTVTHNDTEVDTIQNITVGLQATPPGLVSVREQPSSLTIESLGRGQSAFFRWVYNTTGTGVVSFNATYDQAPIGTYFLSTVDILAPPAAGGQSTVTIDGKNCTAPYNPSQWTLLGSTAYISGSVSDLTDNDSNYAIFRSYYTGTNADINDFVDNNSSNVDGFANRGTHSNFTAMQYGPDGIMDTLKEVDTSLGGVEQWVLPTGFDDPGGVWSTETNAYDNDTGTRASCSVPPNSWSNYLVLNHSVIICSKIRYYIGRSQTDLSQVQIDIYNGSWVNVYSGAGTWETYTNVSFTGTSVTQMRFRFYNSHGVQSRTAYVYEGHFLQSLPSPAYVLDLEVQWSGVDLSQTNEWLCIYGGTMASESLLVDAWNGSAWNNVFASLLSGWNNVSVSTYLVASNFTIRFRDANPSGPTQSNWNIDVSLLHLWAAAIDQYTAEVEFVGSSNVQIWTQLVWQISSAWDVGAVNVTIQFYNYALGSYATSGDGYVSYVSTSSANTNELKNQTITSNPTDFKNSTGYWRVRIKGVKATSTQFLLKANWIDFETSYSSTGASVPYKAWQRYTIMATTATGDRIPYAYVSIYANGTSVVFRNATDGTPISNPGWVRLDANGELQLELQSTNGTAEAFVLSAVVGSVLGQKTITQEAP